MNLFLLTAFAAATAATATEHATLRGSDYSPPAPTKITDLKAHWDALAAEAAFMQVQIAEGFSEAQCNANCEIAKAEDPNMNRGRCRKDCTTIADQGGTGQRSLTCGSCDTLPPGGRREERCRVSCQAGREVRVETCDEAFTCLECSAWCAGSSGLLDRCLNEVGNCNGNRNSRNNNDDFNNNDDGNLCIDARSCNECKSWCSGSAKSACKSRECGREELSETFKKVYLQ